MAIGNRSPAGTVVHADHGWEFTSWTFTRRAKEPDLVPLMGSIGDSSDSAVIESFWGPCAGRTAQPPSLEDPHRAGQRDLRIPGDLHNRRRRHSVLGMRTPIEYEMLHPTAQTMA
jgi:putative transposase